MEYKVERDGTLLPFLLERMEGRSRSSVKSYLTHGQVAVNGCHTTRHDTPLTAGDTVTVTKHRTAGTLHHPMLRIVYEDERLIVADKRNGLLSVGTEKEHRKTAFYILSEYIKRNNPAARLFVVHRLDRETSGLMIYAKDQRTQEILQKNWKTMGAR
ncbi:MAG: pseudouridine synthase [Alistipes inops]